MIEITGDNVLDVFAAEENKIEQLHTNKTKRLFNLLNINYI